MIHLKSKLASFEAVLRAENPDLLTSYRQIKLEVEKLEDKLARSRNDAYNAEVLLNATLIRLKESKTLNRALRRKELEYNH